mgnify:FL=1
MTYTTEYKRTGPIIIGVSGIYVNQLCDLSKTIYIYACGMRTLIKVGHQYVWGPREGDDVI